VRKEKKQAKQLGNSTDLDFVKEEHCRDELIIHEATGRPTAINEL